MIATAAVLWWKLTRANEQNVLLRGELSKLRRRLNNLIP
jgi:hypothetical protein